ncbi:MAG: LamG domain-containing protein, partial [Leptospiraceae bacterium]|nr:LamG domain-containing protein [Leptospiraceae bacterium]
VYKRQPDSNRALVSKDGGGCPSRFNLNRDSGGFFRFEFNSDYATTSTYVGESAIVTATHASNQISIVKNGGGSSLYSVGSLSGTTSCPLQIGANTYGSNYFNGLISEVLIFTNGLDNADKEIVQCYLSTKYRIAVEHPCQ